MIQLASEISKISTNKDSSLKIVLETQELMPAEMAFLFEMLNKQIWTAFKDVPVAAEDIKAPEVLIDKEAGEKSKSESLRDVIFVLWTKNGKQGDFDTFYKKQMDKFIDWVKDKLN